jgi:hypothetical protein
LIVPVQRLLGDVWLSTVDRWFVKDRVTYPAANAQGRDE